VSRKFSRAGDGSIRILGSNSPTRLLTSEPHAARRLMQETREVMQWRPWKVGLILFTLATVVGLVEGTQVYLGAGAQGEFISWARALGATMPSWYVLALLLPPTVWLAKRFRLDHGGWRSAALPVHLLASVAFTAVHLVVALWVSDYVLKPPPHLPFLQNMTRLLTMFFVVDTLYYWALIGGYYAIDFGRRYREKERAASALALQTSRLETSLSRANLEALRMQLNPHFLFNTLNTISVLAMKGERNRVVRMINRLSDLLRLSLENNRQTMSLAEEVDFLQRYLEIEQVRFRDRLTVLMDVPEELLDAEVPSLILQPIVENAVVHGVSRQLEGGSIAIRARRQGARLLLTVVDSGPGFSEDERSNGTGVGLSNTAARLEQLYGTHHVLQQRNLIEGGALVSIEIPYRVLTREPQEEVEWKRSAL
jgi:two-component system, LytTR family, sensor kinase